MDNMISLFRRIRIDSKEDVILLVVVGIVYIGGTFLMKQFAPNVPQKTANIIVCIAAIIIGVIAALAL